jgi:ATP-dependent DNA helicase RecQ
LTGIIEQFKRSLKEGNTTSFISYENCDSNSKEYVCFQFLQKLYTYPDVCIDHLVLLRQFLRWSGNNFYIKDLHEIFKKRLKEFEISYDWDNYLRVKPYNPNWLDNFDKDIQIYIDDIPENCVPDEKLESEPWLHQFGSSKEFEKWNSNAQKEACFFALRASVGSTNLIGLPTGGGKSLIFQLLSKFSSGLTLVIVPTIALAIDHTLSSNKIFKNFSEISPKYYSGTNENIDADEIIESLLNGTCKLLFTSPEACVSGKLKSVLDKISLQGSLSNIVIDEAHILEDWGGDFRLEFQIISVLIKKWLTNSDKTLRTYLLSATYTENCIKILKTLFTELNWNEFVSHRFRPEMKYYAVPFELQKVNRDKKLIECLKFLPRPLILYVTKVVDSIELYEKLKYEEGYKDIACFNGKTKNSDRLTIINDWKEKKIDLIVATSAFGIGVDKSDVRCVIHACLPENINRYYQEIGRGGRDGFSSICLIMPTLEEKNVAISLLPTFLGERKTKIRWEQMIKEKCFAENNEYVIPMDSRHDELIIGRESKENILWNKRLILMMVRVGLIEIKEIINKKTDKEENYKEYLKIRCINFHPNNFSTLHNKIGPYRLNELINSKKTLEKFSKYINRQEKMSRILRYTYGENVVPFDTQCALSRKKIDVHAAPKLEVPKSKIVHNQIIDIVENEFNFENKLGKSRLVKIIRSLITEKKILTFLCSKYFYNEIKKDLKEAFENNNNYFYRFVIEENIDQFICQNDEIIVCIHNNLLSDKIINYRSARRVSHFFSNGKNFVDRNGRLILNDFNSKKFLYEDWLNEI